MSTYIQKNKRKRKRKEEEDKKNNEEKGQKKKRYESTIISVCETKMDTVKTKQNVIKMIDNRLIKVVRGYQKEKSKTSQVFKV